MDDRLAGVQFNLGSNIYSNLAIHLDLYNRPMLKVFGFNTKPTTQSKSAVNYAHIRQKLEQAPVEVACTQTPVLLLVLKIRKYI